MKVYVKATHEVLPTFDKVIESSDLPILMGELTHYGYDIENEIMLGEIEMKEIDLNTVPFNGFDETPHMCHDCCNVTPKCQLTEIESCPICGSHKMIQIDERL